MVILLSLIIMYMSSLDRWWFFTIVCQTSTETYFIDDAGYLGSRTSLKFSLATAKGQKQTESIFTRTYIYIDIFREDKKVQHIQHNRAVYTTRHGSRKCVLNRANFVPYLGQLLNSCALLHLIMEEKEDPQPAPACPSHSPLTKP